MYMYNPFTTLFGRQWYSYTVLLMIGAVVSLVWLIYRAPKDKRTATIDVFLAGLVGGVSIGRLVHVALQWQYFADRIPEIRKIYEQGGLDWHGVFIGALFSMLVMAKWRKIDMPHLLDTFTVLIPLLALLAWWGCGTIACAYGLPVEHMTDYPGGITWLQRDIYGIIEPRFATQFLGVGWSIILLLLAILLHRRDWLRGVRLWLMVLLLSIGMFGIGFLRGDFSLMLHNLRDEQWLDIGMILFAGIQFGRTIFISRQNTG
jgi:prolipoprotein diacylglyceryltransferase